MKTRKRQRHLTWSLLVALVVYLLSLCTLNPRVHAVLLSQIAQAHHSATGHCTLPSSSSPGQKGGSTIPACCAWVNMHRAAPLSSIQLDLSPLTVLLFLSPKIPPLSNVTQPSSLIPVLHASHPPPLYLWHAALLI
jgi:hypothetical protein